VAVAYQWENNESAEVIAILLPVTLYFNPSTRLDNAKIFDDSLLATCGVA